jgi:hypothetical protein
MSCARIIDRIGAASIEPFVDLAGIEANEMPDAHEGYLILRDEPTYLAGGNP